jgi:hypothetical protein
MYGTGYITLAYYTYSQSRHLFPTFTLKYMYIMHYRSIETEIRKGDEHEYEIIRKTWCWDESEKIRAFILLVAHLWNK